MRTKRTKDGEGENGDYVPIGGRRLANKRGIEANAKKAADKKKTLRGLMNEKFRLKGVPKLLKPVDCKMPGNLDVGKPDKFPGIRLVTNGARNQPIGESLHYPLSGLGTKITLKHDPFKNQMFMKTNSVANRISIKQAALRQARGKVLYRTRAVHNFDDQAIADQTKKKQKIAVHEPPLGPRKS